MTDITGDTHREFRRVSIPLYVHTSFRSGSSRKETPLWQTFLPAKKDGKIVSYRIRVARGYDACGNKLGPFELTWAPPEGMTARQTEKELDRVAVGSEQQCKAGLAGNGKQRFSAYADYVLKLKAQSGELRRHTLARYQDLLKRINAGIGHIKLCDLRPQHLNALYEQLAKNGLRRSSGKATLRPDAGLPERIHAAGYTSIEKFLKECAGISATTYKSAVKGRTISADCAKKLANAFIGCMP